MRIWRFITSSGIGTDEFADRRWSLSVVKPEDEYGPEGYRRLMSAQTLAAGWEPWIFEANRDQGLEEFANYSETVCSHRAFDVIRSLAGDSVEFLPAEIRFRGKRLDVDYGFLNVLTVLPSIDRTKSWETIHKHWDGTTLHEHKMYWDLILIPEIRQQHPHIWRPAEDMHYVLCSDELRLLTVREKINGCDFWRMADDPGPEHEAFPSPWPPKRTLKRKSTEKRSQSRRPRGSGGEVDDSRGGGQTP